MKWYMGWIIEILESAPLDIWFHPMWVTRKFSPQLEQMWTEERMRRVINRRALSFPKRDDRIDARGVTTRIRGAEASA